MSEAELDDLNDFMGQFIERLNKLDYSGTCDYDEQLQQYTGLYQDGETIVSWREDEDALNWRLYVDDRENDMVIHYSWTPDYNIKRDGKAITRAELKDMLYEDVE